MPINAARSILFTLFTPARSFRVINHAKRNSLVLSALVATFLFTAPAQATCGGGGGGGMGGMDSTKVYDVPWKRISDRDQPAKASMLVYWFPSSNGEYETSSLHVSRTLSMYATRCIALYQADPKSELGKKFIANSKLPLVVLTNSDGTVIGKVDASTGGDLKVSDVENMMNDEVEKRRDAMKAKLDSGSQKADAGDTKGAIEDYRTILEQKCILPQLGKRAVRELHKLGVDDVSESDIPDGPKFDKSLGEKITKDMLAGLEAENAEKFQDAKKFYESAHNLDPADPVPLRYLGELYRHDIGDWDKATDIYKEILSMESDPLSKAVALHGWGKITIHNGDFKQGEQMMEQSVEVFPLPLAYRNLAVYWNSEGDSAKCNHYIDESLKHSPKDPFNRVFAAVFMAGNGRKDEALQIARDNEGLLPASYNLAAIYAQAGNKDKALAMLKRHFYEYERNEQVRSEEMMEARVDRVFDSLLADKDFLALTNGADGKLPMRGVVPKMTAH